MTVRAGRRSRLAFGGLAASGALSLALTGLASAHHAWTEIDTSRTLTLTGTVKLLHWENPHASMLFEVVDGVGPDARRTDWTVEMSGISRMESRGLTPAILAQGAHLVIVASPAWDVPHVVRANRIRRDDKDYGLY